LYNLFIVRKASHKGQLLKGGVAEKRLRNTDIDVHALYSLESGCSACFVWCCSFIHSTILSLQNDRSPFQLVAMRDK